MTVVAIIAILAGIVLGVAGYAGAKADKGRAIADMEKIRSALEEYRIAKGSYIAKSSDTAMTDASFNVLTNYNHNLNFTDPWGNAYLYKKTGQYQYQLWSQGPDKTDAADDLDSAHSTQ